MGIEPTEDASQRPPPVLKTGPVTRSGSATAAESSRCPPRAGDESAHATPPLGPHIRVLLPGERSALRVHDAETLARRRLHHDPALDVRNATGAEHLEAARLGLEVVGLDVEMDAALMLDLLYEQDRLARVGIQQAIQRIALGFGPPAASKRATPELRSGVEIGGLAIEDEGRQPAAMHPRSLR